VPAAIEEDVMKIELTTDEANLIMAALDERDDTMRRASSAIGIGIGLMLEPARSNIRALKNKIVDAWQRGE
jgi:hypothetical protein